MPTYYNSINYLNSEEASKRLGVSVLTFRKMREKAGLRGISITGKGQNKFYTPEEVDALQLQRVKPDLPDDVPAVQATREKPCFIQLGAIFININDIIYVDFSDEHSCMVTLRSLDMKEYGHLVASETMQFSDDTREYHALRAWLAQRTEVLVPQYKQIVASV